MTFDFEVVVLNEEGRFERTEFSNSEELGDFYDIVGWTEEGRLRAELEDMPILSGLLGPMFGGFSNNGMHYTVRYESQAAYNLLSD